MSEKRSARTFKLFPKQLNDLENAIKLSKEKNGFTNRGDCVHDMALKYLTDLKEDVIIEIHDEGETDQVEVKFASEIELERICELGFLKKIIDLKTGFKLWFCLKDVARKGKPILISDGGDIPSIKEFCHACHTGTLIDEQYKRAGKQVLAIKRFGESEIKTEVFTCVHPELNFSQVITTGELICELRKLRVNIDKVCIPEKCDYFAKSILTFHVKETEAFKDFQRALEAPQ